MSIRSSMCWLTEETAPSTNVPSLTEWLTLLWKVKVGHMTLNEDDAGETCFEKVISCVCRCRCDQQQVLTDIHLSLALSDPVWNPSLVSLQRSTHCHPGDVPSRVSLFLTPLMFLFPPPDSQVSPSHPPRVPRLSQVYVGLLRGQRGRWPFRCRIQ